MAKPSICFVGLDNYSVLNPDYQGPIGGASVQQVFIAKGLAKLGYDVSMVVYDHGQPEGEKVNGITVHKAHRKGSGFPVARFFVPNMTSVLTALRRANADWYHQSCAGALTGIVAWYCERNRKKFLYRVAHNNDCLSGRQLVRLWRDRRIYEYGLRRADKVVVQGESQQLLLKSHYGLDGTIVRSAVGIPSCDDKGDAHRDIDLLWVGELRPWKRPEIALRIARDLPTISLHIIGGPAVGELKVFQRVEEEATLIRNVTFVGPVPYSEVGTYFRRARLLLSTSATEGFPNTYLEAWANSVPTVGFFDPDGLVAAHGLGGVPSSVEEMTRQVDMLLGNEEERTETGKRARAYVTQEHAPEAVARAYETLIQERS